MTASFDRYTQELLGANRAVDQAVRSLHGARVLVTGASGIVGFAVARILDLVGARLVLHSRTPYEAVVHALSADVTWRHGALEELLVPSEEFDVAFHCATFGQPDKFSAQWRQTVGLNVDVLFRILDASRKVGFASTTEIYSGVTVAATEDMVGTTTPQHARSVYIESKRLGEAICVHSGRAVANRIALATGPFPKADDSRVVYQLARRALRDQHLALQGGGGNIRQYQYSFACAVRFIVSTLLGAQPVYNNAGPYIVSIEQLGRMIAARVGCAFDAAPAQQGMMGAPAVVSVDTTRLTREFPYLHDIDPPLEVFMDAIIEASREH